MKHNLFDTIIEKLYLKNPNNLVYTDEMTGAKTKAYYDKIIKEKYKYDECLCIFIDIDDLKFTNDNKGHNEGNMLIKYIYDELSNMTDILEICRVGGDEFIVIAKPNFKKIQLRRIQYISFGYYLKHTNESIEYAERRADEIMYKYKKIHKSKSKYMRG